eukprot:4195229-Amphidinium_carterae.1
MDQGGIAANFAGCDQPVWAVILQDGGLVERAGQVLEVPEAVTQEPAVAEAAAAEASDAAQATPAAPMPLRAAA